MFEIQISQLKKIIKADDQKTLFEILIQNSIPIGASCNGDGSCGKCYIEVVEGAENITKTDDIEKKILDKLELSKNFRISCLIKLKGSIKIQTSYW